MADNHCDAWSAGMKFSAVILAGGKSSRMGEDKAWLPVDDEPLLTRQIQVAREVGACEVFISGRRGADYSAWDCRVLHDRLLEVGPLAGIERALDEMRTPLLLVLAVDMPRMPGSFLRRLWADCEMSAGVVPRLNGRVEPVAAFYPKTSLSLINEMILTSNKKGLRGECVQVERKSLSASRFAVKCVKEKLVKFFDVTEVQARFFSNWNSPQDVE